MIARKLSITSFSILLSAGLISPDAYPLTTRHLAIGGISAIAASALYGHLILPWYTNKRQEAETGVQLPTISVNKNNGVHIIAP